MKAAQVDEILNRKAIEIAYPGSTVLTTLSDVIAFFVAHPELNADALLRTCATEIKNGLLPFQVLIEPNGAFYRVPVFTSPHVAYSVLMSLVYKVGTEDYYEETLRSMLTEVKKRMGQGTDPMAIHKASPRLITAACLIEMGVLHTDCDMGIDIIDVAKAEVETKGG